jgi:hypothetical protein
MEFIENCILFGTLLCPFILLVLSYYRVLKVRSNRKLALISFVVVYALFVGASELLDNRLSLELHQFDLDGNGIYSESELTPEAIVAMDNWGNDTGRTFAPIVGFLFSLIYTLLIFGGNKVVQLIYSRFAQREST